MSQETEFEEMVTNGATVGEEDWRALAGAWRAKYGELQGKLIKVQGKLIKRLEGAMGELAAEVVELRGKR